MYALFLTLHNVVRWLVVIFGILAVVHVWIGWLRGREWQGLDSRAIMLFGGMMDLQVLIGLVLYIFFSPYTRMVFANFGGAMSNTDARFYGLEHIAIMLIALAFVHIGSNAAKKVQSSAQKYRRAVLWLSLALLLILAMIPWQRPLLRLFGIVL